MKKNNLFHMIVSYNRFVVLEREVALLQPAHPRPQDVQRHLHEGQVFLEIVFRFQDAAHHQPEGCNAVSTLAAYCFFPKEPAISLEHLNDNQLTLF